jgi:hypothetical protein
VPVHVARAGGVQHRASGEEEQALEGAVVERVIEGRCDGHRGRARHRQGLEEKARAHAEGDDPHVLHAGVGEQPLDVVLHQGVEHPEHRGGGAEPDQGHAPPDRAATQEIEADAQQAVDAQFDHDSRHERRDVARRRRMRARQPDVEGDQAGLGAEADEG